MPGSNVPKSLRSNESWSVARYSWHGIHSLDMICHSRLFWSDSRSGRAMNQEGWVILFSLLHGFSHFLPASWYVPFTPWLFHCEQVSLPNSTYQWGWALRLFRLALLSCSLTSRKVPAQAFCFRANMWADLQCCEHYTEFQLSVEGGWWCRRWSYWGFRAERWDIASDRASHSVQADLYLS